MVSIAKKVISECEQFCYPAGPKVGERIELLPHEIEFINGAFGEGIERIAFTAPRGGSKTMITALFATLAIDGCLLQKGSHNIIVAASMEQARAAFEYVESFLGDKYEDKIPRHLKISSGMVQKINNTTHKTSLRVISSDYRKAHGLRLNLALLDEPAMWEDTNEKNFKMYNAIRGALGKIPNNRVFVLGTLPDDPDHWFCELLESNDVDVFTYKLQADPDADPSLESTWLACNPVAKSSITLYNTLKKEASQLDNPKDLEYFKAYKLNLGCPETLGGDPVLTQEEFDALRGGSRAGEHGFGVDLGSRAAMSAVAACYTNGHIECLAALGCNAKMDREYEMAVETGELYVSPHPVPPVQELIDLAIVRFGEPAFIVADSYRFDELKEVVTAHYPNTFLMLRHDLDAQAADLHMFRELARALQISTNSLLLELANSGSRVTNSKGLLKLARETQGGRRKDHRDDTLAAAITGASQCRLMAASSQPANMRIEWV